jgi:hypothetical protein
MRRRTRWLAWLGASVLGCAALAGRADTPQDLLERYGGQARAADPAFAGFSAERGYALYREKHAIMGLGAVSCASCHRKDPRDQIRAHRVDILCRACHVINDEEHPEPGQAKKRLIEPFTPGANPKRFSDYDTTERYFKVNCRLVFKRECTAREKGDLITYLLSVEGPAVHPPDPDPTRRPIAEDGP